MTDVYFVKESKICLASLCSGAQLVHVYKGFESYLKPSEKVEGSSSSHIC